MNADAEDTSTSERKVEMTPLREDSKGTAEGAKKDKRYRCTTSAAKSSMDGMDDAKPTVKSSDPSQNSTSGNSNDSSVQQVDDTTPKANSPDQCQNTDKLEDVNEQSQPGLRYALSSVPPEDFGSFVKRHDNSLSFPEKLMLLLIHVETMRSKAGKSVEHEAIAWSADGMSFVVRDKLCLTSFWLPKFFAYGKFSSFTRKLYRWGFRKISTSKNDSSSVVAFGNENFQRDNLDLLSSMKSITASKLRNEILAESSPQTIRPTFVSVPAASQIEDLTPTDNQQPFPSLPLFDLQSALGSRLNVPNPTSQQILENLVAYNQLASMRPVQTVDPSYAQAIAHLQLLANTSRGQSNAAIIPPQIQQNTLLNLSSQATDSYLLSQLTQNASGLFQREHHVPLSAQERQFLEALSGLMLRRTSKQYQPPGEER